MKNTKKKSEIEIIKKAPALAAYVKKTAEKSLWAWLRDGCKEALLNAEGGSRLASLDINRIENTAEAGTLDVEACFDGVSFIMELKSVSRPVQKDKRKVPLIKTTLTVNQAMKMRARIIAGGRSWLFIEVGGTRRYLISGKHAVELSKPIKETRLAKLAEWVEEPLDVIMAATGR